MVSDNLTRIIIISSVYLDLVDSDLLTGITVTATSSGYFFSATTLQCRRVGHNVMYNGCLETEKRSIIQKNRRSIYKQDRR